jgi:hypothetical protein
VLYPRTPSGVGAIPQDSLRGWCYISGLPQWLVLDPRTPLGVGPVPQDSLRGWCYAPGLPQGLVLYPRTPSGVGAIPQDSLRGSAISQDSLRSWCYTSGVGYVISLFTFIYFISICICHFICFAVNVRRWLVSLVQYLLQLAYLLCNQSYCPFY